MVVTDLTVGVILFGSAYFVIFLRVRVAALGDNLLSIVGCVYLPLFIVRSVKFLFVLLNLSNRVLWRLKPVGVYFENLFRIPHPRSPPLKMLFVKAVASFLK